MLLTIFDTMRIILMLAILVPSFAISDNAFVRQYAHSGIFFSVVAVKDGYVLAANRQTPERNRFEVLIMKVRPLSGIIVWKRSYGSGADMIGWQLITTNDHGFALIGKRKLSDLSRWDVLLLKLDSAGKLQWSKKYFNYFGDQKGQVIQIGNGGFLMSAVSADSNLTIQRVDRIGNLLWSRTFEEIFAYPFSLFSIGKEMFSCAIEEGGELALIKFDGSGRIHLKKKIRSIPGSSMTGAFLISENGIIVSGRFNMLDGRENMFVARLDEDWNVVWNKTFLGEIQKPFGPVLGQLEVVDIKQSPDGSILIASKIYFPLNVPSTCILKISQAGKVLDAGWFKAEGDSTPNRVLPLNRNELLIIGPTFDTPSFGNPSGFLLKLDSSGNVPGCKSFQTLLLKQMNPPLVESREDLNLFPISVPPYEITAVDLQINIPSISGRTICN
jgi:hypothetical protein